MASIPRRTLGGGAAPAVIIFTGCGSGRRSCGGELRMKLRTTGAPQKWVTMCLATRAKMALLLTWRRHTLVPDTAAHAHAKHHPLQWKRGRVQRYTAPEGKGQFTTLERLERCALRWEYTTP